MDYIKLTNELFKIGIESKERCIYIDENYIKKAVSTSSKLLIFLNKDVKKEDILNYLKMNIIKSMI